MITGFDQMKEIETVFDFPANIATMLLNDKIDIGLVPVSILPILKEQHIVTDYGIACTGKVQSVCLYSNVPVDSIENVLLDYQSRTSVQLLKILLAEYWEKDVEFIETREGFKHQIEGTTAGLVIGDRTFALKGTYPFQYDLGEYWKSLTNLPFVFALWVSNKKTDPGFIARFNAQIKSNLEAFFCNIHNKNLNPEEKQYLLQTINYYITEPHKKGLDLFLQKIS
jgi:chorismate dehydratase